MSLINPLPLRKVSRFPFLRELRLNEIISVMRLVDQALEQVLEEGLDKDFATIPGTPKPTLLQAGAEKLAAIFNLGILLDTKINDLPGGHREVIVTAFVRPTLDRQGGRPGRGELHDDGEQVSLQGRSEKSDQSSGACGNIGSTAKA